MEDTGYANYQDQRLQPMDEPEGKTCADCYYFKDVERVQRVPVEVKEDGITRKKYALKEYIGTCIYEVFQADTFEKLYRAEVLQTDPTEEACTDFKDKEDE